MNTKSFFLASLAVFIGIFALDFLIHGVMLKQEYLDTAHIWRPQNEAKMQYMILSQLLFSFIFTYIFIQNYEAKGIKEGLRFGLYIGLFIATFDLGMYCYMPVSFCLISYWMASNIVKGILAGVIASLAYKKN